MGKYKHEIVLLFCFVAFILSIYYLYGIVMPFIIGLVLAFAVAPAIKWIKRFVRNWNIAAILFLLVCLAVSALSVTVLAKYINSDFQRFAQSFSILAADNQEALDATAEKVKSILEVFFDQEKIESYIRTETDSLAVQLENFDASAIDTDAITASLEQIFSGMSSSEEQEPDHRPSFGALTMFFSTLMYFVLILFNFNYFESLISRHFKSPLKSKLGVLAADFNQSFVLYFKLRTKIVLLLAPLYLVCFVILDVPGTLLLSFLIVLLSFVPYLQYLALLPLSLGCLVLSTEGDLSFLTYLSIIAGIFVLASLLEELILTPRIMENNIGMNPVVMVLALSVWGYVLGLTGILIGIPLTSLLIIYFKRFVWPTVQEVGSE
ncbi:MAG: putative PurR-regulated permease PerM [Litorivivens sp.]|jgi:predicted PurR-regulated permease PerM